MICIYNDVGTGVDVAHVARMMRKYTNHDVIYLNAEQLFERKWQRNTALFIMPGGFDLGYKMKLYPKGDEIIQEYVQFGGSYLGICAGSYYATSGIVFNKGQEDQIIETRNLELIPSIAIGPLIPYCSYDYSGSAVFNIDCKEVGECSLLYNGGPFFMNAKEENVIASFYDKAMIL